MISQHHASILFPSYRHRAAMLDAPRVRIIESLVELEHLRSEWQRLEPSDGSPTSQFAWMRCGAEAFKGAGRLRVFVCDNGGALRAVAPLVERGGSWRRLEGLGLAELYEPTDFPCRDESARAAIAVALARTGLPLCLERMPARSPWVACLQSAYRNSGWVRVVPAHGSPFISLDTGWGAAGNPIQCRTPLGLAAGAPPRRSAGTGDRGGAGAALAGRDRQPAGRSLWRRSGGMEGRARIGTGERCGARRVLPQLCGRGGPRGQAEAVLFAHRRHRNGHAAGDRKRRDCRDASCSDVPSRGRSFGPRKRTSASRSGRTPGAYRAPPCWPAIGVALPARWGRSLEDADAAVAGGLAVRVVKGEWPDPDRDLDPRRAYLELIDRLAGRARHVGVATHDRELAREAFARLVAKAPRASSSCSSACRCGPLPRSRARRGSARGCMSRSASHRFPMASETFAAIRGSLCGFCATPCSAVRCGCGSPHNCAMRRHLVPEFSCRGTTSRQSVSTRGTMASAENFSMAARRAASPIASLRGASVNNATKLRESAATSPTSMSSPVCS